MENLDTLYSAQMEMSKKVMTLCVGNQIDTQLAISALGQLQRETRSTIARFYRCERNMHRIMNNLTAK